ncbi:MAG: hypothetical protein ABFC28_05700 [Rikenellaceae bacterium]
MSILLSILIVGLCVFLLSFNIIFRKDGKFPEKEIGENKNLRKLGLTCAKAEEKILWGKNGKMRKGVRYDPADECSATSGCSTCGSTCEGC